MASRLKTTWRTMATVAMRKMEVPNLTALAGPTSHSPPPMDVAAMTAPGPMTLKRLRRLYGGGGGRSGADDCEGVGGVVGGGGGGVGDSQGGRFAGVGGGGVRSGFVSHVKGFSTDGGGELKRGGVGAPTGVKEGMKRASLRE